MKLRSHACPYSPASPSGTLTRHMRIRTEAQGLSRGHVCSDCKGVAFGTASNLKKHIGAVHLKIKRSRGAK